jgi:aryl-alcohol dehydrogenase-like predicted oxidoreductase
MSDHTLTRREFVKVSTAGAAAVALGGSTPLPAAAMPERPLGRTGYRPRLFSLGGQATIERPGTHDESISIVNRAIDLGVNYVDTAAAYGRGISETYIGDVMRTRRREVFLTSKTRDRTRDGSLRILDESLKRLQTDQLDLWQLHNIQTDQDLDQVFGRGGAIEALQAARDQKMVRFLGITGHFDPDVLARGIERFQFDTILMALNPADKHRLSFVDHLLPLANQKQMGVIAMKIPARGRLFREGGITSMKDALTYVMTLPVSTVIVGCDNVRQLEENIEVARAFKPMPAAEMARLERLTASYVSDASWFKKPPTGAGIDDQGMDH